MKLFTKLAIVSAMAISGNAMAGLTGLNDTTMSQTTGQDGLTIKIAPPSTGIKIDSIYVHDKDGLRDLTAAANQGAALVNTATSYGGTGHAGAIVVGKNSGAGNGMSITTGAGQSIVATIDADSGQGNAAGVNGSTAFLNVNLALPANMTVNTGDIGVAGSKRDGITTAAKDVSTRGIVASNYVKILDPLSVDLNGLAMNIQLGNTPQGAMIKTSGTMTGGLALNNLSLTDAAGGGAIVVDKIGVYDNAGANLSLNANIGVTTTGLQIGINGTPMDVMMAGVHLGAASNAAIGDIEIVGLNLVGSSITVTGH